MTDLSNTPPIPENEDITSEPSSPWVMLISMLLLISVLILSSAMLVHYAMNGKEGAARESVFDFAKLMEKGKQFSTRPEIPEEQRKTENEPPVATASKPSDSAIKKFFSGEGRGSVRWPKLKLTGFGTPANGEVGFAIINGKHVVAGSTVNGATLEEILGHGVLVEYKGETKTLIIEVTH